MVEALKVVEKKGGYNIISFKKLRKEADKIILHFETQRSLIDFKMWNKS